MRRPFVEGLQRNMRQIHIRILQNIIDKRSLEDYNRRMYMPFVRNELRKTLVIILSAFLSYTNDANG